MGLSGVLMRSLSMGSLRGLPLRGGCGVVVGSDLQLLVAPGCPSRLSSARRAALSCSPRSPSPHSEAALWGQRAAREERGGGA